VTQSLLRNHTREIRQIHSEAQSAGNGKEEEEKDEAAKGLLLPPPLSAAKQSEVVKEEAALDSAPTKQAQEETDLLTVLSKQYQAAQALLVQLVTSNWRKLRVTDTLQKQAEKGPFTAQALHQAHQTLFLKSSQATSSRSGKLRSVGVRCGAVHFMPPAQVPAAISSFVFRLNQLVLSALGGPSSPPFSRTPAQSALSLQAVLEAAGYALSELVRVHPYTDGNGRMSRLVSDTILSLAGLPWQESCFAGGVVSGQEDGGSFEERKRGRADYVRLVRTSHARGHTGSLAGLLLTRVLRSLRGVQQLEESLIAQEKQESHVRAYREAKKEERCGICFEGLDRNTVSTSCCGAVFDMTCLARWLKQNPSCPHCRAELPFSSAGLGEEGEDGAYSEEHTRRMLHRLYHEYHDHGVSAGVMRFHHHPFDVQAFIGFFPAEDEDDDDGGNEEEEGELHRLISELREPEDMVLPSLADLLPQLLVEAEAEAQAEAQAQASGAETDTTTVLDLTTTTTTTTTTTAIAPDPSTATAIAPDASDPDPAGDERLAREEAKESMSWRDKFDMEEAMERDRAAMEEAMSWEREEQEDEEDARLARAEAALADAAARWTTKGKARRW
jgi:fido (protein-threonine AMPylation protein)